MSSLPHNPNAARLSIQSGAPLDGLTARRFFFVGWLCVLLMYCSSLIAGEEFKRTEDVIYGRKFGTALTMDILQPKKTNGFGIIYVMSAGWVSAHQNIEDAIKVSAYDAFLKRGYTVFAVVHGSQPRFIVSEAMQDLHRAVRFIRHNAAMYGIDPKRLGVVGGSAGGHLALVLGTQTENHVADPHDAIDRESSAVQCVTCFFPPTDLLNYGSPGVNGVDLVHSVFASLKPAFGPLVDTPGGCEKLGRELSPIYSITSNMPPTLLIHGTADYIVPIQQSKVFVQRATELGAKASLIVKEGLGHGWPGLFTNDMKSCADWFDENLRRSP